MAPRRRLLPDPFYRALTMRAHSVAMSDLWLSLIRRACAWPLAAFLLTGAVLAGSLVTPAAAASHHRKSDAPIQVRAGDHKGLSRVLISWPGQVGYQVAETPGKVVVTFDHGGKADLGNTAKQTLRNIKSIAATDSPDHFVVTLAVNAGSHARGFKAGNMVIVDILDGPDNAPGAPVDAAASAVQKADLAKANETTIRVSPAQPLSLAAFRRGPYLWIVADGKLPAAPPAIGGIESGTLAEPTRYASGGATLLRYRIADTDHVRANPESGGWTIVLSSDAQPVAKGLDIEGRTATEQVKVTASGATKVVSFTDPELGDTMKIVPLPSAEQFVAKDRHFAQGDMLDTAEGVVVIAQGKMVVTAGSNAVTLSGLDLSGEIGTAHAAPPPLFDFPAWRAGGPGEILKRRKAIEHAGIVDGESGTRGTAIDLAHLYIANGFGNEALGALDIAAIADPDLPKSLDFLALQGAANALAGRGPEAAADFGTDGLRDNPEAKIWNALANFDGPADKKQEAFAIMASGADTIDKYPVELRNRFALALAALAVEKRDVPAMKSALDMLTREGVEPNALAAVATLKGTMDTVNNKPDNADHHFSTALGFHDDFWNAEALYAEVEGGLARKTMSNKDAIGKLEQVRFGWRGDDLELRVLAKLGELYLAQADYNSALDVLSEVKMLAPNTNYAAAAQTGIVDAGRHAFSADKEASLAPLDALDLYYTLSAALPPHTIPDDDIKVLSDRLAGIGVVDKAATLLEPQMHDATDPAVKVGLANRIAALRLLDDHPDQAVAALDAAAPPPDAKLPDALRIDRKLLQARALSKNGRPDEALATLDGVTTREGDALRVDIAWSQHDWKLSAAALARLAGNPPADGKLDAQQASIVLNEAVALSLDNDTQSLDKLRQAWLAPMSRTDKSGAFALLTSSGSDMHAPNVDAVRASVTGLDIFENFLGSYRKEPGKA